jgi:trimeric autotransporter adhesin
MSGAMHSLPECACCGGFTLKTLNSALIPMMLLTAGGVGAQTISVSTSSLTFSAQAGGSAVSQSFTVSATGGNVPVAVVPSQSWLTVTPSSGTTPQQFTVTANPTSPSVLSTGTYQDTNFRVINLDNTSNTVTIPVTFTVGPISVTPQSLNFAYTVGSDINPLSQNLNLTGQAVNYTVTATTTSGGNWIEPPSPSSGVLPANSQINVLPNLFVLENLSVGTYQGMVTVTPSGASSGINIPVTLTVSPEPPVTVSPTSVNLNYQIGGLNNQGAQQAVTLATTSTTALPYTFGTPTVGNNPQGCQWISVSPSSGTVPANNNTQSTISYNCPAGLPAGSYSGSVPLAVTGGTLSTSSIPVNLLVSNTPLLFLPTGALSFTYELGTNAPAAQTVTPQSSAVLASASSGQMPITATASTSTGNWLSVTLTANPTTGTPISVSVNPVNLLPGTYMGTVTVAPAAGANAGNGAQTIAVTLTVANDASIQASVGTQGLMFPYQVGQATPATQTVTLNSSTGAALTYAVTSPPAESTCGSVNWLAVGGSTTGTTIGSNASFTVSVQNLATLPTGACTGTVTVTATNPVTGNAALGSPLSIPVTLYVSNNPLLVVSSQSLSFTAAASGSGSTQNFTVNSTNPASNIAYTVTETTLNGTSSPWLAVSSAGNTAAGQNTVSVSVIPGLLSAGTYNGTITVTATGSTVANSPLTIPVTFQVTSGTLSLNTNTLGFTYIPGSSTPVAQTVQVTSSGSAVNYTAVANSGSAGANWLSVTPTTGTTPGTLSIGVNGTGLSQGTYVGTVVVTAPNASGSPATIQVTLAVNAGTISASPSPSAGLTFTVGAGATASAAQTITVSSTPVALSFTASATTASGGNWLSVSPSSGTTTGTVQVSVNAGSLAVGTYSGTVTITAAGATGSPITYLVTLNVVSPITITATPAALSFSAILNASAPAAQTVQVGASGASAGFAFTTSVTTAAGGNWLSVTPTSGTEPGSLSVSVNPTGLAAGTYTGTIAISSTSQNGATPATVNVSLSVSAAPTPVVAAVANAASGFIGSVSPGEEVAIYGSNFGPSTVVGATPTGGAYPTTLSNTEVLFDGTAAPVIAVTNGQINVMVPYGVSGRATTAVQVSYLGVTSPAISYNVVTTVPGVYTLNQTGSGQGAILDQALSVNGSNNPAAPGSVVAVYMTGEGITTPPSTTGQLAPTNGTGLNKPVQNVTATVGGVTAQVQYAGSAPGLVYGVMQVNVQIPANAPAGSLPIVITVGTTSTQNGVTVAVN